MGGYRDTLGQIRVCAIALLDMLECALYLGEFPLVLERIQAVLGAEHALRVQFVGRRIGGPVERFDYSRNRQAQIIYL